MRRGAAWLVLALQQAASLNAVSFDAASIKAHRSGGTQIRYETPAGRVSAINVPLRFFIRRAFDLPEARIVGGPA